MTKAEHMAKMVKIFGNRYFDSTDLPGEAWLSFSKWKGCNLKQPYQVSNKGRIKDSRGMIICGNIDPHGYHSISLRYENLKEFKNSFAHSIVLTIFKGPPPDGMIDPTVQHIDHNPLNNCLDNLEWMELVDNCRDAQAIKVKIVDSTSSHVFMSKEEASVCYCEKASGYINDCMKIGIPVTDKFGKPVVVFCQLVNTSEWVKYTPTKSINKPWRMLCTLTDSMGTHEFKSIHAANTYLGQNDGYINYRYKHGLSIINKFTGEEVIVNIPNFKGGA